MSRASDHAPPTGQEPLRQGVQSLESGFRVLRALGDAGGPAALKELAKAAGMSASTAHRHLVSLVRVGLAVQEPRTGRYDLGPAALSLGLAALGRLDGLRAAEEVLSELVAATGETGCLAVPGNLGPTIVSVEPSPRAVTVNVRIGSVLSRLRSASGLVLSAFLPAAAASDLLASQDDTGGPTATEIEVAL
ncbi:MAG: helix-turn-helix domain-containing protein, partial [Pseudomonadota bacterium]|nr:helix-turn-helix domain-containing protein [Pseudomonadota bacterium]